MDAGTWIACKETVQITIGYGLYPIFEVSVFTKLEPEDRVEDMVQPKRDQCTVEGTVDKGTDLFKSDDEA